MAALMSVFARVRPDFTGFQRDAGRQARTHAKTFGEVFGRSAATSIRRQLRDARMTETVTAGARVHGREFGERFSQAAATSIRRGLREANTGRGPMVNVQVNVADIRRQLRDATTVRPIPIRVTVNETQAWREIQAKVRARPITVPLSVAVPNVERQTRQAGQQAGKAFSVGFADRGGTFARVAAIAAARATLFGAAVAAVTPAVIQLTGALLPAVGATAALPAALLAVKAVTSTVKIAVLGVGDAIADGFSGNAEKAAESLKKLPPEARKFAQAVIGMRGQIRGLRTEISNRFFLPFNDEVAALAGRYLPMARRELGGLAGALGGVAEQFAKAATRGRLFGGVRAVLDNTTIGVVRARAAVSPLTNAFGDLLRVTAPVLAQMGAGFATAGTRAARFVSEAAKTGRIRAFLQGGIDTLRELGGILGNLGSIARTVFGAATTSSSSLLTNLRLLTGQAAAFVRSADGASALTGIFETMAVLGRALRTSLGAVLPAITASIRALAPAIQQLAPVAAQFVRAIAPLLPLFAQIASVLIRAAIPALTALARFLNQHTTLLKVVAVALGAYVAAQKLAGIVTAATATITAVQAAGGLLKYLKATQLVSAATKVWTAIQWAFNAALVANPIGIAVVAIAALVAAVVIAYKRSETFRNVVNAVWTAIRVTALGVVRWFTGTALPALKQVWDGIAGRVSWMWNTVLKPIFGLWMTMIRAIVIPLLRRLWQDAKTIFGAIGTVVRAMWIVIQIVFKLWVAYLRTVLFPVIRALYHVFIRPIFALISAVIRSFWNNVARPIFGLIKTAFQNLGISVRAVWNSVIRPVFATFGGFLTRTVVPAFRRGVDMIRAAWNTVRDAARKPISFVVNSVINPLVRGIKRVAGFVGVNHSGLQPIGGFARGGQIPGRPSERDNRLARVADTGRMLKVATGEFITRTRSSMANLPLLEAINRKNGKVTREDVDPYLDGRAGGGPVGDGIGGWLRDRWSDVKSGASSAAGGIRDVFGKIVAGARGVGEFITNPKAALTKLANAALSRIPGGGGIRDTVIGMGRKVIGGVGGWIDKQMGGGLGGGNVKWYQNQMRALRAVFPGLRLISGFRPGARTLGGAPSYHGMGRAVDVPAIRAVAQFIKSRFGRNTKELISPFQEFNLHNGRPRRWTGAIWNQHNFAGGNAHIHWAMRLGGLIKKLAGLPAQVMDSGGTLAPGLNLAYNGLGRPERLVPPDTGGGVHFHFHNSVITSERAAEDLLTRAFKNAVRHRRIVATDLP